MVGGARFPRVLRWPQGAVLGLSWGPLGPSWSGLERGGEWGALGPSWSVGKPKRRICEKCTFYAGFGRILPFSSFRLSDAPRRPKKPPRLPQDGPRGPQEGPKTAQEGPQDAPRGIQEASQDGPKRQKSLIFIMVFESFWHSRLFGFPTLQDGPRGPQDRPKMPQLRAPRRPQDSPRGAQDGPRGPPPRQPQEPPKTAQDGPKKSPRGAVEGEPELASRAFRP